MLASPAGGSFRPESTPNAGVTLHSLELVFQVAFFCFSFFAGGGGWKGETEERRDVSFAYPAKV